MSRYDVLYEYAQRNRDALAHIAYTVPAACAFAPADVDAAIDAAIAAQKKGGVR